MKLGTRCPNPISLLLVMCLCPFAPQAVNIRFRRRKSANAFIRFSI